MIWPQLNWAQLPPGVETQAVPYVTGDERQTQPHLWVMEVNYKPLRMIQVDLPNAKTGKTERRLVWYLCYRAINRPIERRDTNEVSIIDPKPLLDKSSRFIPEFMLITDDNGQQKRYIDRVMPAAQAAIIKRERRDYKNSVEIVGPVPPVSPYDSKSPTELYGVATWRGIDPATDNFTLYMTGFSNGYRTVQDPDGNTIVQRKTLMQEFWRPGDEFEEDETEIRPKGPPRWIYR